MPSLFASRHPNHFTIKLHNIRCFCLFDNKGSLLYIIKSWDNSQADTGTMPRLNLGNIPAIAGKQSWDNSQLYMGKTRAIAGI